MARASSPSHSAAHAGPTARAGTIRVGIGGWTYEPWRGGNFFPADLSHARELEYASRQLTAIEVNGTYYRTQKPETFARWRDATPPGFVFALKASRYCTNRRVLADAGESVERFLGSGIAELGDKLGPLLWQFMPGKAFDAADFGAFLQLLPREVAGIGLRHAVEVRHPSFFEDPAFFALVRRHGVATVFADSADYPSFADITGGFVYARLMRTEARYRAGYAPRMLDHWAEAARSWAAGGDPADLPHAGAAADAAAAGALQGKPRDVFAFFIAGAKERAPAAALELQKRLGIKPGDASAAAAPSRHAKPPAKQAAPRKKPAGGKVASGRGG